MSGEEFEVVFLPLYRKDPMAWPPEIFNVLDGFFADVDDFCGEQLSRTTAWRSSRADSTADGRVTPI